MDRGAWWGGVYRVAKSLTRLKQLNVHSVWVCIDLYKNINSINIYLYKYINIYIHT